MKNKPHIWLTPQDPRHRQVIHAAIKSGDMEAMTSLKGNLDKPICVVFNWFYHSMMITTPTAPSEPGMEEPAAVTIWTPRNRINFRRLVRESDHDTTDDEASDNPIGIPMDTYDFLL